MHDRYECGADHHRRWVGAALLSGGIRAALGALAKGGLDQKYVYTFSWLGRPVIQLPEDLVRIQEVLHDVRPDVIVETGIAHGGSLVFYASLCKAMDKGRVVGIDIEIRPHNRTAIEEHPLSERIKLIEGSSTDPAVLSRVAEEIGPEDAVLIVLDSAHDRAHVRAELEAYCGFVTPGSYIVVADGIMDLVADAPRGNQAWKRDNPIRAVHDFLTAHPEFVAGQPPWPFDESSLRRNVTHWPDGYLRRVS